MPTKLLTLTEEEIGEHFWVQAQVNPKMPQDKMMISQIAQAFRSPGADGKPLMADIDIARFVMEHAYPDEIKKNVEMQWFESQSPDVQKIQSAAMLEKWKQENKDTVKLAEKVLNPDPDKEFEKMKKELTPETFQQIIDTGVQAKLAEMQGVAPDQFMQDTLNQGAVMQQMQDQMGRVPSTVMPPVGGPGTPEPGMPPPVGGPPGGPNPGALPAQFAMTGAEQGAGVVPAVQNAARARRGKPKHNRGR